MAIAGVGFEGVTIYIDVLILRVVFTTHPQPIPALLFQPLQACSSGSCARRLRRLS